MAVDNENAQRNVLPASATPDLPTLPIPVRVLILLLIITLLMLSVLLCLSTIQPSVPSTLPRRQWLTALHQLMHRTSTPPREGTRTTQGSRAQQTSKALGAFSHDFTDLSAAADAAGVYVTTQHQTTSEYQAQEPAVPGPQIFSSRSPEAQLTPGLRRRHHASPQPTQSDMNPTNTKASEQNAMDSTAGAITAVATGDTTTAIIRNWEGGLHGLGISFPTPSLQSHHSTWPPDRASFAASEKSAEAEFTDTEAAVIGEHGSVIELVDLEMGRRWKDIRSSRGLRRDVSNGEKDWVLGGWLIRGVGKAVEILAESLVQLWDVDVGLDPEQGLLVTFYPSSSDSAAK